MTSGKEGKKILKKKKAYHMSARRLNSFYYVSSVNKPKKMATFKT